MPLILALLALCLFPFGASGASEGEALSLPKAALIEPAALAAQLKEPAAPRPVLFHMGFKMLYLQAHIPGSAYTGAANSREGLDGLAAALKKLPKSSAIVLYCGCCPWARCPNVAAAYGKARSLGYKKVKVLHIDSDFGADWVAKGYPTSEGERP